RGSSGPGARLWPPPSGPSPSGHLAGSVALAHHRQQPRHGTPRQRHPGRVRQFSGSPLQPQVEQLLPGILEALVQLGLAQFPQFGRTHVWGSSSRWTNRVLIGSLWPASVSASRATSSLTPASSNITRPGRTTVTQSSGLPLPLPIRVSAGFLV